MLDGKVAVITGGSRGLGLAIARAYVREGAAVVIASRSEGAVAEAVQALKQAGARAVGMACDVGNLAEVQALADLALRTYGALDLWVNNAAVSPAYGPTASVPPEAFAAAVQTNILGTYHGSIVALRHFVPRRQGKLINLLGMGDNRNAPFQSAYASSKAWANRFTQGLAKEYEGSGVGIFALNPGLMLTDLVLRPEVLRGWEERIKPLATVLRMWGNPPEVPAEKAVWLASAATDGKTGLILRQLTPGRMLAGLLRDRLARRPDVKLDPRVVDGVEL
jgi:NAD(P)-dependent dehydrogenase (short-subunit alcohol dehydrogenase family)